MLFQILDWKRIDDDDALLILIFGKNEEGQSICIRLTDFKPYFYVQTKHIGLVTAALKRKKQRYRSIEIMRAKLFDQFRGNDKLPFVKLTFNTYTDFNWAKCQLRDQYQLCEANLDPILRIIHRTKVDACGWARVSKYRRIKDPITRCDIEIECHWTNLKPETLMKTAPYRFVSFDIEASSSHGDFPMAKKDYRKMAQDLCTFYHANYNHHFVIEDRLSVLRVLLRIPFMNGYIRTPKIRYVADGPVSKEALQCVAKAVLDENATDNQIIALMQSKLPKGRQDIARKRRLLKQIRIHIAELEEYAYNVTESIVMCDLKLAFMRYYDGFEISKVYTKDGKKPSEAALNAVLADVFYYLEEYIKFCNGLPVTVKNRGRSKLTKSTFINNITTVLNKYLPAIQGDQIIQIGSTFQILGSPKCYLKHIITLGTCDSFDNSAVLMSENDIHSDQSDVIIESYRTEREVLLAWTKLIQRCDPDILIGYNIFGFDMEFMYQRAEEVGCVEEFCQLGRIIDSNESLVTKELSSAGGAIRNVMKYIPMPGRIIIDLYKILQKSVNLTSYKLDNVCKEYLNYGKRDLPPKQIFIKQRGNAADRAEIAKYCLIDCVLCNELILKLKYINDNIAMANVCKVPLEYIYMRGQGVKIFSLVVYTCNCEGFIVPMLKQIEDPDGYEGAIVLEPKTGIYFEPIAVADFNSLYPSSMISENISHDTWVEIDGPYDNLPEYIYNDIEYDIHIWTYTCPNGQLWGRYVLNDRVRWGRYNPDTNTYDKTYRLNGQTWTAHTYYDKVKDKEIFYWKVNGRVVYPKSQKKTKVKVNRTRVRYVVGQKDPNTGEIVSCHGILCKILMQLLSERKKVKKQMKQETCAFTKSLLNAKQLALKVTANSTYGQTGANTSPIRKKQLAASTTAVGRSMIYFSKNYVEKEYTNKTVMLQDGREIYIKQCECIYGDTDSIFIRFEMYHNDIKLTDQDAVYASMELCTRAAKEISMQLKSPQNLEFEKVIYPFILISKKRYHGHYYTDYSTKFKKKSMGIVLKRRDNAPIVKKVFGKAVDIIMYERDINKSVEFVKSACRDILAGKYPMEDFIISKTLRSYYKNPMQIAHCVLAMRQAARDPGNKFNPNDRVPFVYIETNNPKALQGERIETPQYVIENNLKIDYKMYITNQIQKPVAQIFDLAGIDSDRVFNDILSSSQTGNTGLMQFIGH